VWSFELRPAGKHTRLISRNRFDAAALPVKDKLAYPVIEPGSWVMERKDAPDHQATSRTPHPGAADRLRHGRVGHAVSASVLSPSDR
jgi:hypothetical protein